MSAFSLPTTGTASTLIGELTEPPSYRHLANMVRRCTCYLKHVHMEIAAKRQFPFPCNALSSTLPTNEHGHLLIGKASPILLKQYRIKDEIADGAFSQIFRAQDLHSKKWVAIKVMRVAYDALGQREFGLLRFVARKALRGRQYCKFTFGHYNPPAPRNPMIYVPFLFTVPKCLDAFMFEDHFCVVLDLYSKTLFSMMAPDAIKVVIKDDLVELPQNKPS
jgi:serine/threonine protein kinase